MNASTLSGPPGTPLPRFEASLASHVAQCRRAQGRWFRPALWVERAHGWVAPRFVTTVALASVALVGLSSWT